MLSFKVEYSVSEQGKRGNLYSLENNQSGEQNLQELVDFMKKTLILVADDVLREEQARGFDQKPVVVVDGKENKPVRDVKPFGSIVFAARQAANIVLAPIYEQILRRSPQDTKLYLDSNFVFYNGAVIANNMTEFQTWLDKKVPLKQGDIIRFVNVMPYAGKLEREGITSSNRSTKRLVKARDKKQRSGAKVRTPNGTYFLTFRSLSRKYKYNSNIRFEWINGGSMDLSSVPTVNRAGKPLRKTFHPRSGRKGSYVYPTITVRITERGFLA